MLDRLLMHSNLYSLTTNDLLLASCDLDTFPPNADMYCGIISYVHSVVDKLLLEALKERRLSEKFEQRLSCDLKLMLNKLG